MIGLVLAAGAGTRYGEPKAGVVVNAERLVDRAVRVLREAGVSDVIAVLGAQVSEVPGARVIVNDEWATGMASSLRLGLEACALTDATAACVMLVDLPDIGADVIKVVASDEPDALNVATYSGQQGHPVLLGRKHWQAIASTVSGDQGAREYLHLHASEVRRIEVGTLATGLDLDVPTHSLTVADGSQAT